MTRAQRCFLVAFVATCLSLIGAMVWVALMPGDWQTWQVQLSILTFFVVGEGFGVGMFWLIVRSARWLADHAPDTL